MVTTIILVFISLAIGYLIGLFHKRTGRNMEMIFFYLRRAKINGKNLKRIPHTVRRIYAVLKKRRPLLLQKMRKKYRESKKLSLPAEKPL